MVSFTFILFYFFFCLWDEVIKGSGTRMCLNKQQLKCALIEEDNLKLSCYLNIHFVFWLRRMKLFEKIRSVFPMWCQAACSCVNTWVCVMFFCVTDGCSVLTTLASINYAFGRPD